MGFDWQIYIHVRADPKTGLPVVGWENPVPYNPQDYVVPEEYRTFLTMRNGILRSYTQEAEEDMNMIQLPVEEFVHYFPEWSSVRAKWSEIELDDWTEETHTQFKEALEWMASKQCFMASWSY
jgi:hypothetical protein